MKEKFEKAMADVAKIFKAEIVAGNYEVVDPSEYFSHVNMYVAGHEGLVTLFENGELLVSIRVADMLPEYEAACKKKRDAIIANKEKQIAALQLEIETMRNGNAQQ